MIEMYNINPLRAYSSKYMVQLTSRILGTRSNTPPPPPKKDAAPPAADNEVAAAAGGEAGQVLSEHLKHLSSNVSLKKSTTKRYHRGTVKFFPYFPIFFHPPPLYLPLFLTNLHIISPTNQ